MDPLHYKSATELASLIRRKKIGALELYGFWHDPLLAIMAVWELARW